MCNLMEHYYRNKLNNQARFIYDRLIANIGDFASKGAVNLKMDWNETLLNDATKAYFSLRKDRPEFFFLDRTVSANYWSQGTLTIRFNKRFTNSQISRINNLLRRYIGRIVQKVQNFPILTREEYIYRTIGRDFMYQEGDYSNDISGLLVYRKGVCESLSQLLLIALREADIPSIVVSGESRGEGHSWNKVWVNNREYQLDVTWDMFNCKQNSRLQYFNVSNWKMSLDHHIKND